MRVKDAVRRMVAYNPPLEMRAQGDYLLLDFNESTVPPDPAAIEAMKAYLDAGRTRMYPAYGPFMEKLAAYAGVRPEQVIVTNGSDSAIQLIAHALLGPGDEMIMPRPGFFVIETCAQAQGARVVSPPYRKPEMAFPFEEVQMAVTPNTRLIVLIHPNNPTGTSPTLAQIEHILGANPDVGVMVDEAYFEFTGRTAAPLIDRYDNLVVTRTFSKAFALAGLRLGYALSNPDFILQLHKVRIPYDVNAVAVAGAMAQLDRREPWQAYVREVMDQAKPMVERFFDEHGVDYVKGEANFMLVRPDDVQQAFAYLKENGILVRPQRPPADDCFRMSVGTVADMRRFMEVFSRYLAGRSPQQRRA